MTTKPTSVETYLQNTEHRMIRFGGFVARLFGDGSVSFQINGLFDEDGPVVALESAQVDELVDALQGRGSVGEAFGTLH